MPVCKTLAVTAVAALLAVPAVPAGAQIVRMDTAPSATLIDSAQWGRPGHRYVGGPGTWTRSWGGPVRVRPVAPVRPVYGGYYGLRRYGYYGRPYYPRPYYARPYYARPYYARPYYGDYYRPYYYGGYYRPYYGYGYDPGAAIAAGIFGLAAGAIASSAIAAPPRRYDAGWVAYCSRKYKSFNPRTGTYLGYDGRRHVCR
ncbi:BA14K family protein [Chelatococcus sp. XZ-Ab1]|uniref:BA14K family protein n=1 Tax=Chelatococcus sp. XZ-Ab1 TaxID=3034027 RepID=UPI0023E377E6|nr:BA14K family protein [Chelatococcus sp. XZ-Ab1]